MGHRGKPSQCHAGPGLRSPPGKSSSGRHVRPGGRRGPRPAPLAAVGHRLHHPHCDRPVGRPPCLRRSREPHPGRARWRWTHRILRTDSFLLWTLRRPWLDQQWDAQVLLGLAYRAAALLTLRSGMSLAAQSLRPELFALPCFAAIAWLIAGWTEHPARLWSAIPIEIACANRSRHLLPRSRPADSGEPGWPGPAYRRSATDVRGRRRRARGAREPARLACLVPRLGDRHEPADPRTARDGRTYWTAGTCRSSLSLATSRET
jgi:hypothetical protein